MTQQINSVAASNSDGEAPPSKEIYFTAYKGLVTTKLFASELKQNLKATGLEDYAQLCDVITDSLDMLTTKLRDELVSKHGIEAVV